MKKRKAWTQGNKQRVFAMLDKGMSAGQIAEVMGVTRGAVMGLKFREYGKNKPYSPPEPQKLDRVSENLLKDGSHWHRKCLKCRKKVVIPKNQFICKTCKELPIFGGMA